MTTIDPVVLPVIFCKESTMIERSWSILFVGLYNLWRESDRDSPACLQDVFTFLMSPLFGVSTLYGLRRSLRLRERGLIIDAPYCRNTLL